jgi:polyhydroxyalkanoate synthase
MELVHPRQIDRLLHAWLGHWTLGLSPASLLLAYFDWNLHLALSPGKQQQLLERALRNGYQLNRYIWEAATPARCAECIESLPQDPRFRDPAWSVWPFNVSHQAFLLAEQWCRDATTETHGVSRHHEEVVAYTVRQWLDVFSPSNGLLTNPEVLRETFQRGGANLVEGLHNLLEDINQQTLGLKPAASKAYQVGRNLAVTPGKVVYRNHLIELLQYQPTTESVCECPVLIVPAWIMKYYILDLSPHNSLVKYLVDHGHTVFMVSWKNPDESDRNLSMDDYLKRGVMDALDAVSEITQSPKINGVGYCLGGTLFSIAACAMARDNDLRLASLTLFAAQVDFTEPGELSLFIDESEVTFLEDLMWEQGYLNAQQMTAAFQMLRSYDLIWSYRVRSYLMGKRQEMIDLMAWNADATRMPYRMHSGYLRSLFLNNDLATGRYQVDGRPVALTDIRVPIFAVGTERDHVSPWRSVYKTHLLTDTEVTFVLTSGGHNAGIVSEPGHPRRYYRITTRSATDYYLAPETWEAQTPRRENSWWLAWEPWLAARSMAQVTPPPLGAVESGYPVLEEAPGSYVLMS